LDVVDKRCAARDMMFSFHIEYVLEDAKVT